MERLLLSKELGVSSNRIDIGIHCQEGINGEGDRSFDGDGQITGLGSTIIVPEAGNTPMASSPSSYNSTELDLPNMYEANPGPSPHLDEGKEWWVRPTLTPKPPFAPSIEMPAVLNADIGNNETAVNRGRIDAGEAALAPDALLASRECIEWGGVVDGTGNEYGLAAEDWLDAAHALLDPVADPGT